MFALKHFPCNSCWESKITFRHSSKRNGFWSYQPCSPKVSTWALKSNIVEKCPSSPINSKSSSSFILKTSPTVKASCFSKVSCFNSSKKSPTPFTASTILIQVASPSGPSGSKDGKLTSFLILIIASIRNPATPLSNHQFTIS